MRAIAIIVLALLSIAAKPEPGLSLNAADWDILYSPTMPAHPTPLNGMVGWYVDFPSQDGVHYVTTPYRADISQRSAVTITAQTVALETPMFTWPPDECSGTGANTRVLLEQKGDKLSAFQPSYRWWSNPIAYDLGSFSVATLTTPLTPNQWSNVFGANGATIPAEFSTALAHLGRIGLTFGGGCFFGHGVWMASGHARFILTNLQIL